MSFFAAVAGVGLAAVFAVAGFAKLRSAEASVDAMRAFGAPSRLAGPLGILLPLAELTTAALLLAGAAGGPVPLSAAALVAAGLLVLFSLAIAFSLLRGRTPSCRCFGQLHATPVSGWTLARNGALIGVAAFAAREGDPAAAVPVASAAALAMLGGLALGGPRRGTAAGPEPGSVARVRPGDFAPNFASQEVDGSAGSLAEALGRGSPLMLVFTDPDCGPCIALAPRIAAWQRDLGDALTVLRVQHRGSTAQRYGVDGTPTGVLIGVDGVTLDLAEGGPAIETLVAGVAPGADAGRETTRADPGGAPIRRRELIARAVVGWATSVGLLAAPAHAGNGQLGIKCRHKRCGNRCCPRKAKCRRKGKRDVCICPDGRPACRNRCCPESFVCRRRGRRRRCACPDGEIVCSGRCVPRTDPRHCGRCGHRCPSGTSCVDGRCVGGDGTGNGPDGSGGCDCPHGQTCCEGQCTDLNESEQHCGECGRSCPDGQTCCDGRCRSIASDPKNCGSCGRRCAGDDVCSEGECRGRCRRGLTNCRGRCVDTSSDGRHCGGCAGCNGPFDTGECCNGKCCDYNASTCCPGGCKNLALDSDNCGGCGNVCPEGSFCRFGVCSGF